MAKRVLRIRHQTAAADAFQGKEGEITVDLTNKTIRVHDDVTPGGVESARKDLTTSPAAVAGSSDGKMTAAQATELVNATANVLLRLIASNNLSDLVSAATARGNLGVDAAGTDNSTDVTLSGTPNYLTIIGQDIVRALIDMASHVTGLLALANGGTGSSTASGARANLNVDAAGTDNSTDVTLAGTPNYITIVGQAITRGLISLTSHISGILPIANGGTNSSSASGGLSNLGGAPLASPALTGNPTAPTQAADNNSTRIATTAYVQTEIAPAAVTGYTGVLFTYVKEVLSLTQLALVSILTENVWRSIGPTGSGADTIFAVMDDIPLGAKIVTFRVAFGCTNTSASTVQGVSGFFRLAGSATTQGAHSRKLRMDTTNIDSFEKLVIDSYVDVILNANNVFEVSFDKGSNMALSDFTLSVAGFGI